ncbi:MAG: Translation initiation factor IF-2 [Dehalococcoidia bacterium]|nr:Translation initiation factor IF-2 [Chloroflexota bacterium]MBT9158898.1 Translation initiation factor IF-2 [Chloroflexota bacterium]MBT9161604.1 Translation initiation factor IF-2 [Chloroflexota bacterium]
MTQASLGRNSPKKGSRFKVQSSSPLSSPTVNRTPRDEIVLPRSLTVKHLADLLGITPIELIKRLMRIGVMATINQSIDHEIATAIASDLGRKTKIQPDESRVKSQESRVPLPDSRLPTPDSRLITRPAVVTILGHVDHGKTSLLDAIRHSNVADGEVGEITQHIGAYQVTVDGSTGSPQKITFIDTPGHEVFTAMRARGAGVTDIAVLVIAADDGIMPQTREAIDHARSAGVPIIVAINKIDKPNADIERVKQQLAEQNLLVEEWGGDVIAIPVSAKTGKGLPDLLEHLLILAELAELTANPDLPADGVVLEARLDNTRGPLATLLVQKGTLKIGDTILVAGAHWGKVKAMFDHEGKPTGSAGPSVPVEIMGLSKVPFAGDIFTVVDNERKARAMVAEFEVEQQIRTPKSPTLDDISSQIRAGKAKGLNLIIKTDVDGSIEPIRRSLERLENEEVRLRIIHSGSGTITESDVMLAIASRAIIIGFNTRPEPRAKHLADSGGVEIRVYQIIYSLIEDIEKTMTGMLEPTYIEVIEGHAEVRASFAVRYGKIAGCYVTDGKVSRGGLARVLRNGKAVHESSVSSLKHFKESVPQMPAGSECGIGIEGFSDFAIGDIIEFYRKEKQ